MYRGEEISESRKKKKILERITTRQLRDDDKVFLRVKINNCEGIDQDNKDPLGSDYRVFLSVEPGSEYYTTPAAGFRRRPEWNSVCSVPLKLGDCYTKVLSVEVIRMNSDPSDVGTSTGLKVVGRARIPLPLRLNLEINHQRFGLARVDSNGFLTTAGFINVVMELTNFLPFCYY